MSRAARAERTILHVDMDAFYAAIEMRDDPSLAGRPVVVGAEPEGGRGRGVVSTANYRAREFGVHSAMPISEAYRRCPGAVYLHPRMGHYGGVSKRIFEIFGRFTDQVEPLSLDEAFLDVTASRALFGDGPAIATRIRDAIQEEERLTASVGVAASKYVAKVASDLEKPDGLTIVPVGGERAFLAPLDVARLWGAGPAAQRRLRRMGARTIGDVACLDRRVLETALGKMGSRFHALANGLDQRPVVSGGRRKSLGHETTFNEDLEDRERVELRLLGLCEETARGLRGRALTGRTIHLKLRFDGFETLTRQRTLDSGVDTTERIWPIALELFRQADRTTRRVRLIGVSLSGLARDSGRQLALFEPDVDGRESAATAGTDAAVADAVDRLVDRFGPASVTRAALLESSERSTPGA